MSGFDGVMAQLFAGGIYFACYLKLYRLGFPAVRPYFHICNVGAYPVARDTGSAASALIPFRAMTNIGADISDSRNLADKSARVFMSAISSHRIDHGYVLAKTFRFINPSYAFVASDFMLAFRQSMGGINQCLIALFERPHGLSHIFYVSYRRTDVRIRSFYWFWHYVPFFSFNLIT